LGDAGGPEREADAAGVVALVMQEQGQHGEDTEMAGRPQQQPADEREHVACERHGRVVMTHRHAVKLIRWWTGYVPGLDRVGTKSVLRRGGLRGIVGA
jgi:hypothetical protein